MSDKDKLNAILHATVEQQLMKQTVGAIRVDDGYVFVFPAEVLRNLLEKAEAVESKRALLFVKHGETIDVEGSLN